MPKRPERAPRGERTEPLDPAVEELRAGIVEGTLGAAAGQGDAEAGRAAWDRLAEDKPRSEVAA